MQSKDGSILASAKKSQVDNEAKKEGNQLIEEMNKIMEKERMEAPTNLQMCLTKPFILLYIMNMFSIVSSFFALNNFKKYGQYNGLTNENYLAWLGSLASIFNALRFLWSSMTDYYSYKMIYTILLCMQIVLNCTVQRTTDSAALYMIWISLMLFCQGGHFTLVPNVLKKIYGS